MDLAVLEGLDREPCVARVVLREEYLYGLGVGHGPPHPLLLGFLRGASAGRSVKQNVLPCPCSDRNQIFSPWRSTNFFADRQPNAGAGIVAPGVQALEEHENLFGVLRVHP